MRILPVILLLGLGASISMAEDHPTPNAATNSVALEEIVSQVLSNSPALASVRHKWRAMKERPDIARALPDPMLTYGYWFQNVETRVGAMNQHVAASQKIPFFGKRSLAANKATQEALLAMWEYQTLARDLVLRAKTAYYDLDSIDRSHETLAAQLELLEPIIKTAQSRYASGKSTQQDVLKIQVAMTGIQSRLLDLTEQRKTALARLNALRDVAPDTELTVMSTLQTTPLPPREQALEIAQQYRQELHAAGVAVQRDEIALKLAKKDRWPDFTFGVDYTQINPNIFSRPPDNGQDAVLGFVSLNIPLWFGKLRAERREAEERLEASREAEVNAKNMVSSDVQEAWFRAQISRDQVTLYETSILPRAEQTFEVSRAGYETTKVTFVDLLDSERALLNFRLGLIMSETDFAKARALLERAVGVDLDDISKWQPAKQEEERR